MSYASLYQQVTDITFINRITAAVEKESWKNPTFGDTDYGTAVKAAQVTPQAYFGWPVSVATEDAYEFALNSGNPNPGGDPAVITDADILAAVQYVWPPDPWPAPGALGIPLPAPTREE